MWGAITHPWPSSIDGLQNYGELLLSLSWNPDNLYLVTRPLDHNCLADFTVFHRPHWVASSCPAWPFESTGIQGDLDENMCMYFVGNDVPAGDLAGWGIRRHTGDKSGSRTPYPEPVVFQWQCSGNPVCLELSPQCTLECHWRNASVLPVVFQWLSSGLPVCSNYAN